MKKILLSLFALLSIFAVNAQTEKGKSVIRGGYGIAYNYIISSHKTNTSPTNNLFGGNGHSLQLGYEWDFSSRQNKGFDWYDNGIKGKEIAQTNKLSSVFGFAVDAGLQFGKTSTKDLEAFAKTLTAPVSYKISQSNANWKQIVVMAGPTLTLKKRNRASKPVITLGYRIGFVRELKPKNIKIDKVDGAVTGARVFDKTENSTSFAWQANVSVPVAKLGKRLNLCLEGGYGFNGGTIGLKVVVERIVKLK